MQSRIQRAEFAAWLERTFDLDAETARRYANFIGDHPECDADGNLLVRDFSNKIIDRLPSSRFERTEPLALS